MTTTFASQLLARPSLRLPGLAALARRLAPLADRPATTPVSEQLPAGKILWVESPLGTVVTCDRGVLWITLDGQPQDLILEAGRSWRCESKARLSVHALEDAQFLLARDGAPRA